MSWIGLSALFPNAGRVLAQRPWLDRATVARITLAAALAAWSLSATGTRGAALSIGATLLALVPLRRWAWLAEWRLGPPWAGRQGQG